MKRFAFTILIIAVVSMPAQAQYSGGTGEPNTPYQIATKADLLALAANTGDYGKCFILTADIDMEGQVFTTALIAPDIDNVNSVFDGTAFAGTFDGNGHKIMNFNINGESNLYLGLFGEIDAGGSVNNLGLDNFSVSNGYLYVGGLAGWNGGSIINCYSTGEVNGSGFYCIGGLVGLNEGSISNCYSTCTASGEAGVGGLVGINDGTINNCYSTATVSGLGQLGGLVGVNDGSGSINNCYSTVTASGNGGVGGLVGYNNGGSISSCYSTGTVNIGYASVGGLVGYNESGSISNCYSTASVSGEEEVGGLVGYLRMGSINNCYSTGAVSGSTPWNIGGLVGADSGSVSSSFWDIQTSGQASSAGGDGMTTAQMKTLSTFTSAGWDFTSVWVLPLGQYPMLFLRQAGDLNYDGVVDFKDFAIFAENWLSGE